MMRKSSVFIGSLKLEEVLLAQQELADHLNTQVLLKRPLLSVMAQATSLEVSWLGKEDRERLVLHHHHHHPRKSSNKAHNIKCLSLHLAFKDHLHLSSPSKLAIPRDQRPMDIVPNLLNLPRLLALVKARGSIVDHRVQQRLN
jgi:hypothetical protein